MAETPSHESLIRGLNTGDAAAAEKLDRQYGPSIQALAQRGMDPKLRRREDPETSPNRSSAPSCAGRPRASCTSTTAAGYGRCWKK